MAIGRRITLRGPARLIAWFGLAFAVCAAPARPAAAGEDYEREIERTRKRVHQMLREAEELERAGRREEAQRVRHEAEDLRATIRERRGRREHRGGKVRELEQIHEWLEHGMHALRELGRQDELERLERVAAEVKEKLAHHRGRGGDTEREIVRRRLEVMRYAFEALQQTDRRDAVEQMEHVIHAHELALEGRRDEEAAHIRETAPKLGAQIELLQMAAEILEDRGRKERAEAVARLGRELREVHAKRQAGHKKEIEVARHQVELMRVALDALVEAERADVADVLERAIHARKMALEGRRDEEARQIRERAPKPPQLAEILGLAAEILADRGQREQAE
ncbi:MAG: hypothetical protein ACE5JG_08840, partial [Planctomycetota bacterium]